MSKYVRKRLLTLKDPNRRKWLDIIRNEYLVISWIDIKDIGNTILLIYTEDVVVTRKLGISKETLIKEQICKRTQENKEKALKQDLNRL